MRERAAETKDGGQREVEEEGMHMWKQMMQLEIMEAVFDSAVRIGVAVHNY